MYNSVRQPLRNGVRFPIEPREVGLQDRPAGFADSGERSMAAAAERYNALRAGVLGVPPAHGPEKSSESPRAASRPENSGPSREDIEAAVAGCVQLGLKKHEVEKRLRFLAKPWPDDIGELIAAILRSS